MIKLARKKAQRNRRPVFCRQCHQLKLREAFDRPKLGIRRQCFVEVERARTAGEQQRRPQQLDPESERRLEGKLSRYDPVGHSAEAYRREPGEGSSAGLRRVAFLGETALNPERGVPSHKRFSWPVGRRPPALVEDLPDAKRPPEVHTWGALPPFAHSRFVSSKPPELHGIRASSLWNLTRRSSMQSKSDGVGVAAGSEPPPSQPTHRKWLRVDHLSRLPSHD
jgi:hypothetical protein